MLLTLKVKVACFASVTGVCDSASRQDEPLSLHWLVVYISQLSEKVTFELSKSSNCGLKPPKFKIRRLPDFSQQLPYLSSILAWRPLMQSHCDAICLGFNKQMEIELEYPRSSNAGLQVVILGRRVYTRQGGIWAGYNMSRPIPIKPVGVSVMCQMPSRNNASEVQNDVKPS